jgi:hypothetical protein
MKQDRTPFAFLSDLKPSTTYKILVLIYTLNGSVIEGDPIIKATLPEAE